MKIFNLKIKERICRAHAIFYVEKKFMPTNHFNFLASVLNSKKSYETAAVIHGELKRRSGIWES